MAAIINSDTLGLLNSQMLRQGGMGNLGQAGTGNGDQVTVNSANGNLVIQTQDEFLTGQGIDLPILRTYNSQGLFDDDNGDNWQLGFHARLKDFPATHRKTGSESNFS